MCRGFLKYWYPFLISGRWNQNDQEAAWGRKPLYYAILQPSLNHTYRTLLSLNIGRYYHGFWCLCDSCQSLYHPSLVLPWLRYLLQLFLPLGTFKRLSSDSTFLISAHLASHGDLIQVSNHIISIEKATIISYGDGLTMVNLENNSRIFLQ